MSEDSVAQRVLVGPFTPRGEGICAHEGCGRVNNSRNLCHKHYEWWRRNGLLKPLTRSERFWAKVDTSGDCWVWTKALTTTGYGSFGNGPGKGRKAHRWSYEEAYGEIPEGLVIDHLCRNTKCVRPSHLEAVTFAENVRRGIHATKTHCKHGHAFDEQNTYRTKQGRRICKACRAERMRYYKRRDKDSQAVG